MRTNPLSSAGASGRLFGDVTLVSHYSTAEVAMSELMDDLRGEEPRYYGARMELRMVMPELVDEMGGGGPAPYMRCFGAQQSSNPTCYFGAGRQATPMHFDPAENLLCVVEGCKHLTTFHPADTPHLYPAGERNTTVVYSHVDMCEPPDLGRFGALRQATPHTVTVRRGDVLYLPCDWWHAVRGSEGRNLSINYWFSLHESKRDPRLLLKALGLDAARVGSLSPQAVSRLQLKVQGEYEQQLRQVDAAQQGMEA